MTRNVYLGADLSPGIAAQNFNELKDAAGTILNQVDQNNFPVRAKGLAKEILQKRPALVGLQEAALWRTAPCGSPFIPPQATTCATTSSSSCWTSSTNGPNYRLVVSQPEFDFEIAGQYRPQPGSQLRHQRAADHARRDPRAGRHGRGHA